MSNKNYINEVDYVKRSLINDIYESNEIITRELLLSLIHTNMQMYDKKLLSKKDKDILDGAIKLIWEETFNCKLGEFIYGNSKTAFDINTRNK